MLKQSQTASSNFSYGQIKELQDKFDGHWTRYRELLIRHQYKTMWTKVADVILGLWLITGTFIIGDAGSTLAASEIACGIAIILLEFLSFSSDRIQLRWGVPLVCIWLLFAPLVFKTHAVAAYLSDTLVASMVFTFSILVPGVPGKGGIDMPGPDKPPGWTYNPSSWIRRWLGIALSLLGFFIGRYLAAYQLGYIHHAYDPFFGNGTGRVLTSVISKHFPISDAGLGSVAYILEALSGFMGDRARWRTAPWIVMLFALLVLPLGVTSITLVILQPTVVGAWCGLCLIAAAGLLISVPLAVHEVIAMGQFLLEAKRQRKNFWSVFWLGGTVSGAGAADPDRIHFTIAQRWVESVRGVTVPFSIVMQAAIGIWLMARPELIYSTKVSANWDQLLGAVILTVAAVATAEVTRTARLLNLICGFMLLIVGVVVSGYPSAAFIGDIICGLALIAASIPKEKIFERYGNWDRYIV